MYTVTLSMGLPMIRQVAFVPILFVVFAGDVCADNWPQFRGPNANGSTAEQDLPSEWTTTENVVWSTPMPGPSAATPVVWNDHVFISSSNTSEETIEAIAIDRKSGKELWKHTVAKGVRRDSRSNYAAPTPATDGNVVVFFYGSGHLVAYDFDGKELWQRNIQDEYGTFAFMWTFSTSPLLHDGKLYMQVLQRDVPVSGRGFADKMNESYLLALDPQTGKEIWRHVRDSDAKAESRESFASPIPYNVNGRDELLVVGGDDITGHDPETGKELWRWGTWNPERIGHWRHVPSAVASETTVLVCAPKRDPIYAVKTGKSGTLTDDDLRWVSREKKVLSSDVPTPAYADGDFFILSDVRKSLSRVVPETGEIKWTMRTPGEAKYEASPLVADGKVYLMNFSAEVTVVDAESGKVINTIKMDVAKDDAVRASIIAAHGQLFVRTTDKLYCIAK